MPKIDMQSWEPGYNVHDMLVWICEQLPQPEVLIPCRTCGHDLSEHSGVMDGQPCWFPRAMGAPGRLCRCDAFRPQPSDDDVTVPSDPSA